MTVSLIRSSESHTGSTGSVSEASYSFACGIAGDSPKGIVVFTMQGASSTEKATAVTYGGTSLTKITGGSAADTSTEQGRVTAWFLGSSVPSGAQNVVVTRTNDTTPCYAVAFLLGGAADLVNAVTPVLQQENAAMTAVTIDPGSATAIVLAAGYTGSSTAPTASTGTTLAQSLSGSYAYAFAAGYETTPTTGSRSRGLAAANDDRAQVVVGITEYVPPTYEGAFTTEAVSKVQTIPYYPAQAYPTFVDYSATRTPTYLTEPSSCTVPLGVEAGDVLFLLCWSGDLSNNTVTFQPQDPSSITWNAIGSIQRATAGTYNAVQVFWRRVANASEAGTTITTYHTNESASFTFAETCVAYRGCATSGDPWDAAVYGVETTAVTEMYVEAVTVSGSNRTLLVIECHEDNTAYSSGPTNYSSRFSVVDTTGTDYSMGIWDYENQSSDGAVAVTIASAEVGATLHLSLKPPSTTTHEGAFTSEVLSLVGATGTSDQWIAEAAFTTEVLSTVFIEGAEQVPITHEAALTNEALSLVDVTGSKTEWIAEGTLTTEVFSTVSVIGEQILEATLSSETLSLVGVTGAKTDWMAEATLTTEVLSTVTVSGQKAGTQEGELTTEVLSTVAASGSKTDWVAEGALTVEVLSLVGATGSKTDWVGEGAFTTETLSTVSATATKDEWTAEAAFTSEAVTTTSIIGSEASEVLREGAFTTEAVSLVSMRPWWWIEEFDDYTDWTASSGTLSSDSVHTRDGHAAQVKLSAAASAAAAMYRTLPATVDLSVDGDCIECWFYVDIANFSYFNVTQTIRLGESSSVYWQRQTFGGNMVPGWNVARWTHKSLAGGGANWAANGGISSWANIDYIYIGWTAPSTGDMAITYCSMKAAAKGKRAAFLMTFDDGNASVYTVARSIMNARGIHGTAYVVADQRDGSYMSTSQLATLGGEGHYIGNHTYSHEDLTTLSESEIQTSVSGGTNAIQAISGLESHGVHAAYPLGYYSDEVQVALYKMGNQKSWRLTGGVNHDVAEGHAGPLNIRSQSDIEASAYSAWQNHIDVAYYTGEAFIGLVHDPGGATVSTQEFTDICEYAAVTLGMWSPNIEEWWNQLTDHEGSFTTEAVSAVSVVGQEAIATREGAFTTEAKSDVTATATKTDYLAEASFTTEAVSSIAVSGSELFGGVFTTEAFSTVQATGAAGWMGSLTVNDPSNEEDYWSGDTYTWQFTISPAILSANEDDYFSVWLDNHLGDIIWFEAPPWYIVANQTVYSGSDILPANLISGEYFFHVQYVSATGIYSRTWEVPDHQDLSRRVEGTFTTEAKSDVSAVGEEGVAVREGSFTTEVISAVSATATKTDWTAEASFTTEAVSSISASATKTEWTAEAAFTTEALSTVTTTGTKTDWIAEPSFTTEVVSSVSVTGSETGAAVTWEASLTTEVFSTAVVTATKTDWTAEGTLTAEGVSAVLVTGSETVYGFTIHDGQFTSEAISYGHVSITVLRSPAFTTEVKSRVQVIPTLNDTVITEPVRVTMRRVPPLRLRLMRRYYE